jgi:hypothetical protein
MTSLRKEIKKLCRLKVDELLARYHDTPTAPPIDERAEVGGTRWHEQMAWSLLVRHLGDTVRVRDHIALRRQILKGLLSTKIRASEKRERGVEVVYEEYTLATGSADVLDVLLDRAPEGGALSDFVARSATRAREHVGLLDQELSDDPVFHQLIINDCLDSEHLLSWTLRVIFMLTERSRRPTMEDFDEPFVDPEWLLKQSARLKARWKHENVTHVMIALPHGPLSTLTREVSNMGAMVRHGHAGWKRAAAKVHGEFVLVADQRLVNKQNTLGDTLISVPLEGQPGSNGEEVVGALTRALMHMCAESVSELAVDEDEAGEDGQLELGLEQSSMLAGLVESIPRVVAGIFHVARNDQRLTFINNGEFVDSDSALRLTETVGMDRLSTRSKNRVAAVRSMLERVRLRRTVRSEDGKTTSTWEGPIIQRLDDRIDTQRELPGGLGGVTRTTLHVWRVAPELWRMQDASGESASFMLLDERAFALSVRSSEPFNLYWTIIQRAYNAHKADNHELDRFDADGNFSPTLSVLYTWSGMDKPSDRKNMARARARMLSHLELLAEQELIVSFDEEVLEPSLRTSLTSNTRMRIGLPPTLLCYLPPKAFRTGKNPFGRVVSVAS